VTRNHLRSVAGAVRTGAVRTSAVVAIVIAVSVLALATGCTSDTDTPASPAAPAGCDPALASWARAGFSGAVAVTRAGEVECLAGYGEADREAGTANTGDTVFRIGSITKAVTAAAVLDLVDSGRLALGDRAGDVVPGLAGPAAGVTVGQLLDHRSGLTGALAADDQPLDRDQAVAAISGLGLAFEPGTDQVYSNAGYTLLALAVEARSGTTFRDYFASRVLALPDGRTAGGFWDGEPAAPGPRAAGYTETGARAASPTVEGGHWALDGNGGLGMSARDLAAWVAHLFTERFPARTDLPGWASPPGLDGEQVLAVAGGGDGSAHNGVVAWLPEAERAVVVLSNSDELTAEQLAQAVLPALAHGRPWPEPSRPDRSAADPTALAAAAGTYRLETGGTLAVSAVGDGLVVAPRGADALAALFPLPPGVPTDAVRDHEADVRALLDGETQEGRGERAALEDEIGPIRSVAVTGTLRAGGELRTYVTVASGGDALHAWYAMDGEGGLAAAEIVDGPPTLAVVPGRSGYRPDDPAGTGPDVVVDFVGGGMTVRGPRGSVFAERQA
jgi:CubicO group peptidase (beta-lactamase class C family)